MKEYRTQYCLPRRLKPVVDEAIKLSDKILIDELDCSKSFRRIATKKSRKWIIDNCLKNKTTYWTLIYRNLKDYVGQDDYWELGASFVHTDRVSYFLWIILSPSNGNILVDKFRLKSR